MALYWLTQGADQWVPISGVIGVRVSGQVTSLASLSTGADRSEPHGPCRLPARVVRTCYGDCQGAGGGTGVPG